ncbi:MAG: cation transporter [Lachnospiraceae bacterium]|nr:cation transporter [Lachnospiraceae bacterium]
MNRDKIIVRTSIIGILANVFLAAFKAGVGIIANSIAVILDAVNNLSDALSSVITIIGTKIAGKQPDKKHPLGHGRVEYLSAAIIAVIVLYAGITSLVESVKKIISPEKPDYSAVSLIVISVAVAVKILLGMYVKSVGEKVNSDSLRASGKDALMDSIISASTLVAAVIFILFKISVEAWLGVIISIVIIKSGFDMLKETISHILGERIDSDIAKDIKNTICGFKDVYGAYDLILHNYGPDRLIGSVHIEVPDFYSVEELDSLEREIVNRVYERHNTVITGISVYAKNTRNDKAMTIHDDIRKMVMAHDDVLQMHGFYLNEKDGTIHFDIIIDFSADRQGIYNEIYEEVQRNYPDYRLTIALDADISD